MLRIIAIVIVSTFLFGCDPAHLGYVRLRAADVPSAATGAIILKTSHIADALQVLDEVTASNGFKVEQLSADAHERGILRSYSRSYLRYPEHGMYRHVTLMVCLRERGKILEISIGEFVASEESDFAKQIRLAIEDQLAKRLKGVQVVSEP